MLLALKQRTPDFNASKPRLEIYVFFSSSEREEEMVMMRRFISNKRVPRMSFLSILSIAFTFTAFTLASSSTNIAPPEDDESCANLDVLAQAKALSPPVSTATMQGEFEGIEFWQEHDSLLKHAWKVWEARLPPSLLCNEIESIFDPKMHQMVEYMWEKCTYKFCTLNDEEQVETLWTEVASGVFRGQLLSPHGVECLRGVLDAVHSSEIPRRRPNGMNRHGIIIDCNTPGAVCLESLTELVYAHIVERYFRPIGRMLFPSRIGRGDDEEYYGFTIRYSATEDIKLTEHTDASIVTLNVNLNLPEEANYTGSQITFNDQVRDKTTNVTFDVPGMALIHLGNLKHQTQPILQGERQNLVLWLFGEHGYVRFSPYDPNNIDDQRKVMSDPNYRWTSS